MFDLLDSPSKPPIKQSHIKQEIPHTPLDHHTDPLHDPFLQKSPHKPHEYAHVHPVQEVPHTPIDHTHDKAHDPFLQQSPHKPHAH